MRGRFGRCTSHEKKSQIGQSAPSAPRRGAAAREDATSPRRRPSVPWRAELRGTQVPSYCELFPSLRPIALRAPTVRFSCVPLILSAENVKWWDLFVLISTSAVRLHMDVRLKG